jgi:hypothetical protein
MPRFSSHYSIYLEALASFDRPATAKEIHSRAVEKFGIENIKGGTESVRTSLRRYIPLGKVRLPERGKYEATVMAVDPAMALEAKQRMLDAENKRLREDLCKAEVELSRLRAELEGAKLLS